jgi:pimeloyl-ACP methyl ester carboxylesterase
LLVYRSYPLDMRNERITRAFVLVHGGGRNAVDSFNTALGAAFLAGALEDTVLVSPRFASNTGPPCSDTLAPDEANWICEDQRPESWRNGSGTIGNEKITSFDFADEILSKLARKDVFPNLKGIVFAGHSGGGQFTVRYAMANQSQDRLGVPITYVVSNPDALVYLDPLRPTAAAYPTAASAPGYVVTAPGDLFVPFADARNCAGYNNWQYGLQGRTGYTARLSDEQLKRQLGARAVTYLLGGLDILPVLGFDGSCPAMAQGPTRLARGIAFGRYVNERYGAHHETIVVPNCGHNDRCMFTANAALPLLFPTHK